MDSEPEPDPDDVEAAVKGTVTDAGSSDLIDGAEVTVLRADEDEQLGQATTGSTGNYEVSFTVPENDTPDQLALEADAEGFMVKTDTVGFEESLTQDITLEAAAMEATASGEVTDGESGEGIEGASVTGTSSDGTVLFEDTTDASGMYQRTFEVADEPDEVTIMAEAEGFESDDQALTFSEEITADFQLSPATMEATASGTATNRDTGDLIEGATVMGTSGDGSMLFETKTDANGEYQETFEVADEPDEVTITAEAENFESGQQTVAFSEEVTADFQLSPATTEATANGTATRTDTDDPIEGATVVGTATDTSDELFETTTDAGGQYEAAIEVKATGEPDEVAIEADAEDFESANQTLEFTEEMTADFELVPKTTEATASGSITRSDTGDPIEGTTVVGVAAGTGDELFETTTDSEGQYSATFEVKDPDKPDEVTIEASAEDFESSEKTVAFAEELTVDLELEPKEVDVTVSGTVVAELDGSAVEGVDVSAFRTGEDEALGTTTSGSGGSYELSFTVLAPDAPEELRLKVEERRFADASLTVGFSESITRDIQLPSIEISTIEELQAIQTDSDFPLDGYYVQTADIDASEITSWEPIGDSEIPFGGKLNGNGFQITGLTIGRESEDDVALVRHASGESVLESVVLKDVDISGSDGVAGLVATDIGPNGDGPTIRNSKVTGNITGDLGVAGLISNSRGAEIQNSVFSGTLRGGAGGLVSRNRKTDIYNSESHGNIVTDRGAGGLVFSLKNAVVEDSKSTMDITVQDPADLIDGALGGLVGVARSGSTIRRSFSNSDIEGKEGSTAEAGGLVGTALFTAEIRKSYATGSVSGAENVGGLVGSIQDDAMVIESYSAGNVSQGEDIGGVVGVNGNEVTESFWDTEVSGETDGVGRGDPGGTTGLTTDEMQGESAEQNMDGFDFQETWQVVTGDYPALFWEEN